MSGWWGPQGAVVMGPDHPSALAGSPLRPRLHAGMDAQMNKWKDRRRQKSSVIIRAAGTLRWKTPGWKTPSSATPAIRPGSVCGGALQRGSAGPSCGPVH